MGLAARDEATRSFQSWSLCAFTAAATDWGVIFYRGTAGAPTGVKSEVIAVRRCTPGQANVIDVDHDGADADIIKVAVFTVDGVRSALKAPS